MTDPSIWWAVGRSVELTALTVAISFAIGLVLALILNKPFPGRSIVRSLFLIAWAMPAFVAALVWGWMYNDQFGLAGDRAAVLSLHADAWWDEGAATVSLSCEHAGRAVRVSRIGNSHARWLEMGSPQDPTAEQVAALRTASGLKTAETFPTDHGRLPEHRLTVATHEAVLCEVVP